MWFDRLVLSPSLLLGSSFVVLGGEIDLSTGMVSTLAGCTTALLITKAGFTTFPAILVAILIGAIIGTFTGCIVTFLKIPAFIGSLGVQYIVQGTILITTNSMPITGLPDDFLFLGRGYIANVLPFPIIIMLVVLYYWRSGSKVHSVWTQRYLCWRESGRSQALRLER